MRRRFIILLTVLLFAPAFGVECPSGHYVYEETCVSCPNAPVDSSLASDLNATDIINCYARKLTGDTIHGQYLKNGQWSTIQICYWDISQNEYANCTEKKIFIACNAGYFIDDDRPLNDEFINSCTLCAPGTYTQSYIANQNLVAGHKCDTCPPGSTSPAGASNVNQCIPCNDGMFVNNGVCETCPPGVICVGGMMTCPIGKYLSNNVCELCPTTYPLSATTATNINECFLMTTPGEYVPGPQAQPIACPADKFCPGAENVYYSYGRYRAVEWIQSDGTAYIDTGMRTRPEYEYRVHATLTGAILGKSIALFGARTDYESADMLLLATSVNEGGMRYDRGSHSSVFYSAQNSWMNDGLFHEVLMTANGGSTLYVDNQPVISTTRTPVAGKYNVVLFGMNTAGAVSIIDSTNKIKSYSVINTNTGALVQNLVAAYDASSQKYGMYDTVTDTFIANASTGSLTGGDVISNEYLGNISSKISCADATNGIAPFSPAGSDNISDCGHLLHIGDKLLYLRSEKRTVPALHVKIGNNIFYGDMEPDVERGHMRIKVGDTVYSVFNANID